MIAQTTTSPPAAMPVAPVIVEVGTGVAVETKARDGEALETGLQTVSVGETGVVDTKTMPEPQPIKKNRIQDTSPIIMGIQGLEPLPGDRVVVWRVHLACWSVVGFDAKSKMDSLKKLNIPIRYHFQVNGKKRQYCYYSGPYKNRQEAMDVIRKIDRVINLPELSIQEQG